MMSANFLSLALKNKYPNCELEAAGVHVGLPEGYQGSSEVGHLNMGAGRIVEQELKRMMDMIKDGTLFTAGPFKNAIDNCAGKKSALHLMGLVQDEGVHAHQDHLFAIMKHAKARGIKKVYIHFFSDGRDTPPRSSLGFIKETELKISEIGIGEIATLMGRYYAMDRSEKWELTDLAIRNVEHFERAKQVTAAQRAALDRALHSDQYWWASAEPWWSIEMIEAGAKELRDVVLSLSVSAATKRKAEELYKNILLSHFCSS